MTPAAAHKARLYSIYNNMRQRCINKNRWDYPYYGGRGITICPEWADSFPAFMAWALENGYGPTLTLDRVKSDGPYSPTNCRWATRKEQANNRRTTKLITMDGRTLSITQWAEELGIEPCTLWRRLQKGWPVERALTEPVHIEKRSRRVRS